MQDNRQKHCVGNRIQSHDEHFVSVSCNVRGHRWWWRLTDLPLLVAVYARAVLAQPFCVGVRRGEGKWGSGFGGGHSAHDESNMCVECSLWRGECLKA